MEAAGATEVISRGRLLDLCGQRSKEEGGSCDGSLVQAVCKDLALSQEDDPQAPADQVRNLCDNRKLAIPCEIPVQFKSLVGYNSKNTYLDRPPNCWSWFERSAKKSEQDVSTNSNVCLDIGYKHQ